MQVGGDRGSPTQSTISLVIAEDQEITRLGLRLAIERFADMCVVGEAKDGQSAIAKVEELKPNVVTMDIGLPCIDGIEATRRIKENSASTRVLMLTSHDHDEDIFAALSAGADGYCLKEASAEIIAAAIRAVNDGAAWLDPAIAKRVLLPRAAGSAPGRRSGAPSGRDKFALSPRENEILELLVEGLSNQEMAERLIVSSETIKTHMRHIMEKLAVSDRTQAAVKALREGLLVKAKA